jgi:hypothetical protein
MADITTRGGMELLRIVRAETRLYGIIEASSIDEKANLP